MGCTEQIPLFLWHQSRFQGWDLGQFLRVGLRRIPGFLGVGIFAGPFLLGISQDFMDAPEMGRKLRLPNRGILIPQRGSNNLELSPWSQGYSCSSQPRVFHGILGTLCGSNPWWSFLLYSKGAFKGFLLLWEVKGPHGIYGLFHCLIPYFPVSDCNGNARSSWAGTREFLCQHSGNPLPFIPLEHPMELGVEMGCLHSLDPGYSQRDQCQLHH